MLCPISSNSQTKKFKKKADVQNSNLPYVLGHTLYAFYGQTADVVYRFPVFRKYKFKDEPNPDEKIFGPNNA